MKSLVISFLILFATVVDAMAIEKAIYWTSPVMDPMVVAEVAKFDLVIADLENWVNNPESLKALKRLNPKLKLIMYANPMELYHRPMDNRKIGWQLYNMVKEPPYDKWWLKTTMGENIVFYKQLPLWMMNLSTDCPKVNGQTWSQYFARFLTEKMFVHEPRPDGFFGDNPTCYIGWINNELLKPKNGLIDSNRDGVADKGDVLDKNWCDGQKEFYSIILKAMGKRFLVITNKGELNLMQPIKLVNGIMFEEFPNNYLGDKMAGGWYQCLENYLEAGNQSIIHSKWPADPEHFRFVFYSAMLGDGYFMAGHSNRNWYAEYDESKKLGKPVGEVAKTSQYWFRGFENGILAVWPMSRKVEIVLFKNKK